MNLFGWWEKFLVGNKTYVVAFLAALFNILLALGWIHVSTGQETSIDALLAALGFAGFRAALNK